jgi:hypothetical protein
MFSGAPVRRRRAIAAKADVGERAPTTPRSHEASRDDLLQRR